MRLWLSHEIWEAGSLFAVSVEPDDEDLGDDCRLTEARERLCGHSRHGEEDKQVDENRCYFVHGSPVVSCYQRGVAPSCARNVAPFRTLI